MHLSYIISKKNADILPAGGKEINHLRIRAISALVCTALLLTTDIYLPAAACSSVELESKEGDVFWFRTCDMDDGYNVFGENGIKCGLYLCINEKI